MEKQRDGSAEGSDLLQVSLLSTSTINKDALARVRLNKNAQIVRRGREQRGALDPKTELRNCCVTTKHVLYVCYIMETKQ